ncbi:MAG: molybdenum cofactor guanylyltransferase [Trueperaceae bacterium]|nr:molybdenum cofactor guanylyltransferase [Trueperaceae bacterium]
MRRPPSPSATSEAGPSAASDAPRYAGAVLAGGRARRFGSDKCAYRYRGATLLEHALASLHEAEERMIVGAPERSFPGVRWIPDALPGLGALGGVHAALLSSSTPWLAVTGCDMPFLPSLLWRVLLARADDALLVVPEGPTGLEPLAATYHRDLLPWIEERLNAGGGSLHALVNAAPARIVPWRELGELLDDDAFLNANRPEDLP